MKRRMLALLLAVTIAAGLLPAPAGAAESAARIMTAEEFAAMEAGGNYVLAADITVAEPYPEFNGSFDGGGHTVTLAIEQSAHYAGLFGKLTGGAVVKNVTVEGAVTAVGKNYVGGIAGQANTYEGDIVIENCLVNANLDGTRYVGGIVGQISSSHTVSIRQCANTGTVTAANMPAGGLAGAIDGGSSVIADSCNHGAVTGFSYVGGIVGQTNNSSTPTISNCYSTGPVNATSEYSPTIGALAGSMPAGGSITNCYALSGTADALIGADKSVNAQVMFKAEDEMRSADFVQILGPAFIPKPGGYPALSWQIPTAKVLFSISPANAVLTVSDSADKAVHSSAAGANRAVSLPAGPYTYVVTSPGYTAQHGSFEVTEDQAGGNLTVEPISAHLAIVEEDWGVLTFSVTGAEVYEITVTLDGAAVEPTGQNTYKLLIDTEYAYTVAADGCKMAAGSVTLAEASATESVALQEKGFPSPVFDPLKGYATVEYFSSNTDKVSTEQAFADTGDGSLVSGNVGKDGTTVSAVLTVSQSVPLARLSFSYQVSSEKNYDKFTVKQNDAVIGTYSGEVSDISALTVYGGDILTLSYSKDSSGSGGSQDRVLLSGFHIAPVYKAAFINAPVGASITVRQNGEPIEPDGGVYLLEDGAYTYSVSAFGYANIIDAPLTVSGANQEISLADMVELARHSVTFQVTLPVDGSDEGTQVTVQYGAQVIPAEPGGGYRLPDGDYTYTVCNPLCDEAAGAFSVAGGDLKIPVTLARKTVFEDFFAGIIPYFSVTNDKSYPFLPGTDGGETFLQSTNNSGYSTTTGSVTLKAAAPVRLSFQYRTSAYGGYSEPYSYGLLIQKGGQTLDSFAGESSGWTAYSLTASSGEEIKLSFKYTSHYGDYENWARLKGFTAVPLYAVSFLSLPEGAALTLTQGGETVAPVDGAENTYLLENGAYTYTVSGFGYETKTGSLTVNGADQTVNIPALSPLPTRKVSFFVDPSGASVVLTHAKAGEQSAANGVYALPAGELYRYTVTAENFVPFTGLLYLDEDKDISLTLADAGAPWDGSARTQPRTVEIGGVSCYQISSGAELAWFSDAVNGGTCAANAVLTQNINLGGKTWNGIGTYSNPFTGVFDGSGMTVSGLRGGNGLFDTVGAGGTVKNVSVSGVISGSGNLGGVAGTNGGLIENCAFAGSIVNSSGFGSTGGITGRSQGASSVIRGCVNQGDLQNKTGSSNSQLNLGGIAGYAYGTVENCYNTGSVGTDPTKATNHGVGGLVGTAYSGSTLQNLYTVGIVTGPAGGVGAVVGDMNGTADGVYFLVEACHTAFGSGEGSAEMKSAEKLRTDSFVLALRGGGTSFNRDGEGINGGFPVLSWQGGNEPAVTPDETYVAAAKAALTLKTAGGALTPAADGSYVFQSPTQLLLDASAESGVSIAWASGDGALVTADGAVSLPIEGKAEVLLTATLSKGTAIDTKSFCLIIWSRAAQDQAYLQDIAREFEARNIIVEPVQGYDLDLAGFLARKLEQELGFHVAWNSGDAGLTVSFVSPGVKVYGAEDVDYISPDGGVTFYSSDNPGAVSALNYALYRDAVFALGLNGQQVQVKAQVRIGWDINETMKRMDEALKALTWDGIRGQNPSGSTLVPGASAGNWWDTETVTEPIVHELALPTRLPDALYGTISWRSSGGALTIYATGEVDENGYERYTAYLNRPVKGQADATVTLTAVMSFNLLSETERREYKEGVTSEKNFIITVAANDKDPSEEILAALEGYPALLRDFADKQKPVDPFAVAADLQMPTPQDLTDAGVMDRYDQKVAMLSSNPDVLDFYGFHAYVYRPLPGQEDATVDYTVIISDYSSGVELARKTFTLTVKAFAQEEIDAAAALMARVTEEAVYWEAIRGENLSPNSVITDLSPFEEILLEEDGTLRYVRGTVNLTFGGVEVDDLPGYDPYINETWRQFRTTRPTVVEYETLSVARPEYDTPVTIDSVLTHSALGKYWEKFGNTAFSAEYAQFEQFYRQSVSATITVKGTKGGENPDPEPSSLSVKVSIAGVDGFQADATTVTGLDPYTSTAWSAVSRFLSRKGYSYEGSGAYLIAVTDPAGLRLEEQQYGRDSGWMYQVNGAFPDTGMSSYYLQGGETIQLIYTADYTAEPDISTGGSAQKDQTLVKPAVTLSGDTAVAKVTEKALADALKAAISSNGVITISPENTGIATSLAFELPVKSVQNIAADPRAALVLETGGGTVSLPHAVLLSLSGQADGGELTIIVTRRAAGALKDSLPGIDLMGASAAEVAILSGGKPITRFGGEALTLSLPVDEGRFRPGRAYRVLAVDAGGAAETLSGHCVSRGGGLFVDVSTVHLTVFVALPQAELPFADVARNAWYRDGVQYVYDYTLFQGVGADRFDPESIMTRASFVTTLYRMEGEPAVTASSPFPDVSAGLWYADAVLWANAQGVAGGGDGLFRPEGALTREQLAVLLYRYARHKAFPAEAAASLNGCVDRESVSPWAADAMSWAVSVGLLTGRDGNRLAPGEAATRAETASILMRFHRKFFAR